jgi:protein-S-isoprenylcysteine O-methyltransferase Ste14
MRGKMEFDDVLLALFGCLVVAAIVVRLVIVFRQTGTFPVMVHGGDSAYNFILRVNLAIFVLEGVVIVCYTALDPWFYSFLVPISYLEARATQLMGIGIAYLALAWAIVAQAQMGSAWRVGIDADADGPLVTRGLYSVSRHPTYLGFVAIAVGLFLAMPNAMSLVACVLAVVILSIEVRLEEAFLRSHHGAAYDAYLKRTRRWL